MEVWERAMRRFMVWLVCRTGFWLEAKIVRGTLVERLLRR